MKHRMHQDTPDQKSIISADLPSQSFLRFIDDFTVYKIVVCQNDRYLLNIEDGILYREDAHRICIEVELFRVVRRECIYKDKVVEDE